MHSIRVNASACYDILLGPGLLLRAGEHLRAVHAPCRAAIVTDENVYALYGEALGASLQRAGFSPFFVRFPGGEEHKNLETLGSVLGAFAENGLTRGDLAVALGGGVTGDLAGFAAAVYERGMPFTQVPTTLLCAVDASVGGKTAVDLPQGKNLAGAFHQPALVLCDTEILERLPEDILRQGMAEVVKYAVLRGAGLPEMILSGAWRHRMEEMTAACVKIKREYVQADERDEGERQYLNLGHTFGHPIEVLSNYRVSHGEAVAMGLMMAARAADMETEPLERLLSACGLKWECPYPAAELARVALSDKKRRGDTVTLVLPHGIGDCELRKVPAGELLRYFEKGTGERP